MIHIAKVLQKHNLKVLAVAVNISYSRLKKITEGAAMSVGEAVAIGTHLKLDARELIQHQTDEQFKLVNYKFT